MWGAADARGVGRARATHAMNGQRMIQPRNCCGPTASVCESGMRASSRATHPVPGQASTGNAYGRHRGERLRRPCWWERNHGNALGRHHGEGHPTAVASTSARKERPRTLSQAPPACANMAGRLARPSGVVPPNQRMQPDAAVRRPRSRRFWQLFQV
jgi:hypothetical protein